jgi:hypothetical protein
VIIAVVQWRSGTRQQRGKPCLPLNQRLCADVLAVEVQEIKDKEHQTGRVASVRRGPDHANNAVGINAADLSVEICLPDLSEVMAAESAGYLCVQSRPVRVSSLTAPRSSRACIRYPSNLISCSHSGPSGAASTSLVSCGFIQFGSVVVSLHLPSAIDRVTAATRDAKIHRALAASL